MPPRTILIGSIILLLALSGVAARDDQLRVDFERDIRPIFAAHCIACHGPQKQRSGFRTDRREAIIKGGDSGEPAVIPGKSADSRLIRFVSGTDAKSTMPPKGERLTSRQVELLRQWIDEGAEMPEDKANGVEHWSLQAVKKVPPPSVVDAIVGNPIDAYILAKLREHDLSPSEPAHRRDLIRRVYFDMLGLPPSIEETESFINDERPDAYDRLIERVLASPRYGERWAQHWLDVVRYGDTDGFEVNTPRPNAWPYRDWVIRAFNEDMPYTRFVLAQLAGDTIGEDAATGFLVAGPALLPGQTGKDLLSQLQARQDELNEIVNATGTAFLGLTLGCARCHNHKFDPIPQSDYFAVQAVFAGVRFEERPWRTHDAERSQQERKKLAVELASVERRLNDMEPLARTTDISGPKRPAVHARRNVERFNPVEARFIRFTVAATNNGIEPCIDELEIYSDEATPRNIALATAGAKSAASSTYRGDAQHQLAHINDGRYGNGRSWISAERGQGWVQIELPAVTRIDCIVWGRDRDGRFSDRVPTEYRIEAAVEAGKWETVASSDDRLPYAARTPPRAASRAVFPQEQQKEYDSLWQRFDKLYPLVHLSGAGPMVFAGSFVEPEPTFRLHRGDPVQKRERVHPGALSVLQSAVGTLSLDENAKEHQRRAALANWIIRPDNPLPARVLVNRLWQHHFGAGLVDTPSDFGANGSRPTHSELLDYLADYFVNSGWSTKAVHRLILTSSTYRQTSIPRPEPMAVDAQSRLLWRFPPRRLEAEVIRDCILATSGALDSRAGGPGYLLFKPNENYVRVYDAREEWGPAEWRRMVYSHKVRMAQDGVFGAFDCPDGGLPAPKRSRSTTAIQALNLFNSTFVTQQAEILARRIQSQEVDDAGVQTDLAFKIALQRLPTPLERDASVSVVKQHGLAALCRVLFNTNEFLFIP